MAQSRAKWSTVAALLFGASIGLCDDAVESFGKKQTGQLQQAKNVWIFRTDAGMQIPLERVAFIRFTPAAVPLPRAPLTHTLLLAGDERVTGLLKGIDARKVHFVTSWGRHAALDRAQVLGIENANESAPVLRDDFESPPDPWRLTGGVSIAQDRAFLGKASLKFDKPNQQAERIWTTNLRDGEVRLHFFESGKPVKGQFIISLLAREMTRRSPAFLLDSRGATCADMKTMFASTKPAPGWHVLVFDLKGDRIRIYVDDACLGETSLSAGAAIVGLRCAVEGPASPGGWSIDEVHVARRLPHAVRTQADRDQDSLVLEHGEQVFGRIENADHVGVSLNAKFGRRTYSWSKLRGILFAKQNQNEPVAAPEITFRPTSGFALDRVRAQLVRWDNEQLIVGHRLFGEVALKRGQLDRLRPAAK